MLLKYSGAGDIPLMFKNTQTGKIESISSQGSLLGFTEDGKYEDTFVKLKSGDSIFMVTDGIMESRSKDGEAFGAQRFHQVLSETSPNNDDFDKIKSDFESFTGGQFEDDVSMINIKFP